MTGGVWWRRWRLRLSREVQVEQHRHHEARGAHGPCHPAGRGARGARESGGGDQSSPRSSKPSSGCRSGRRAVTQPLQKFPRSYLGTERGRERLAAQAGRSRRGGAGRGGTRRGGAGRSEANCAAEERWRSCGCEVPGCGDCLSPAAPGSTRAA